MPKGEETVSATDGIQASLPDCEDGGSGSCRPEDFDSKSDFDGTPSEDTLADSSLHSAHNSNEDAAAGEPRPLDTSPKRGGNDSIATASIPSMSQTKNSSDILKGPNLAVFGSQDGVGDGGQPLAAEGLTSDSPTLGVQSPLPDLVTEGMCETLNRDMATSADVRPPSAMDDVQLLKDLNDYLAGSVNDNNKTEFLVHGVAVSVGGGVDSDVASPVKSEWTCSDDVGSDESECNSAAAEGFKALTTDCEMGTPGGASGETQAPISHRNEPCADFAALLLERCLGAAGGSEGLEVLQSELTKQEQCCRKQRAEINRLIEENEHLRRLTALSVDAGDVSEATADIYEVQMAALEKTITQLQREVDAYRLKMGEHDTAARDTIAAVKRELLGRLDKAKKQVEASDKEKEVMVVNYAQSEKVVLSLRKVLDDQEKKLKENAREREMLQGKIRSLNNERGRLAQSVDAKSSELGNFQRECERLKEDMSSKDIKIKWAQNKLKTEVDAHKDSLSKLEKLQQKLKETREEAEQVRRDCQEMIRTYQESEEIKSNSLDLQLREKESELELERQEKFDQEEVYQTLKGELDAIKRKHKLSIDENNGLTVKLQCLERERLDYEHNLGKLKEQLNASQQEIVDLHAKLAEMDNVMAQISRERDRVAVGQSEIERLRQSNAELQIDMEACRGKEGELLEFTERLTGKNVSLQSEFSCLEAKFQEQEREAMRSRKLIDELEQQNEALTVQYQEEQHLRKQETQLLARKLAEKTKTIESLNLKMDEQDNDIQVLKRKNAASVRELTREVQMLSRRLENCESSRSKQGNGSHIGSRNSSSGSLDQLGGGPTTNGSNGGLVNGTLPQKSVSAQEIRAIERSVDSAPVQPSHQMLIERIVKLQRAHARKNEKLEFLEEHVNQLLHELKKKTKIIQCYVMREEAGAMATMSMDQNKMEISRRGGIMASLYMSQQADEGMTLDLSLEISRKLQAVLEDTLLKNITLKENIKTLGEEIERLAFTRQRQLVN